MRHRLALVCFAVWTAHSTPVPAASAEDALTIWQQVLESDTSAPFDELTHFLEQHNHWPDQKKAQALAERVMRNANLSDNQIIEWFEQHPPVSGIGKWTYAEVLQRTQRPATNITPIIKEAWRDADLLEDEENALLQEFGHMLGVDDHQARIERLLWDGKATMAMHLIPKLPVDRQVLYQARASLIRDEKNAGFLVGQVSSALKGDPGLTYDRLRYRVRKGDTSGVRELLLQTPLDVPHPARWWKIREPEIRRAIDEGNPKLASRLLANHAQTEGAPLADALWLQGWVKLAFLGQPSEAYTAFYHMHDSVRTPVSRARAAYWAARAAEQSGDSSTARNWYTESAMHTTTFYGQLALASLSQDAHLSLPDEPQGTLFDSGDRIKPDLKQAISLCIERAESKLANRLIAHVIETASDESSVLAVAALGHELSAPHISVKAAKKAQQQGIVLKHIGYPRPATEGDLPVERPLTLAITRQESEFDPHAESSAGALGMMQLLPGTAKETARKIEVDYRRESLVEPAYNIRLGSHYLARMLSAYDGSYVLAIASYNAGPGNVRKWTQQFGTPGNDVHDAVNWIEKIPFAETRNYVQRVLENLQVYRALEGDGTLAIQKDLLR